MARTARVVRMPALVTAWETMPRAPSSPNTIARRSATTASAYSAMPIQIFLNKVIAPLRPVRTALSVLEPPCEPGRCRVQRRDDRWRCRHNHGSQVSTQDRSAASGFSRTDADPLRPTRFLRYLMTFIPQEADSTSLQAFMNWPLRADPLMRGASSRWNEAYREYLRTSSRDIFRMYLRHHAARVDSVP